MKEDQISAPGGDLPIRQHWGTWLVLVSKELMKVSISGLASNVQSWKKLHVLFERDQLLLVFWYSPQGWSTKHHQLISWYGIIQWLCSFITAFFSESFNLVLSCLLYLADCLYSWRPSSFFWVEYNQVLSFLTNVVTLHWPEIGHPWWTRPGYLLFGHGDVCHLVFQISWS